MRSRISTTTGYSLRCGLIAIAGLAVATASELPWTDVTEAAGLGGHQVSRLKFADVNSDHRPDAILLPDHQAEATPLIFVNIPASDRDLPFRFQLVAENGLPAIQKEDVLVFSDLDNDGVTDAILGRYLDIYQDDYQPPSEPPLRSSWFSGDGKGHFGNAVPIEEASLATTRAIAVNDVNRDGRLDLFFGNWYQRYFTGYEGFANDLLLQYPSENDSPSFARWPLPRETAPTDYRNDTAGRPTYGVGIAQLDDGLPYLAELNYGRRWNRLYHMSVPARLLKPDSDPEDWSNDPFAKLQEPAALSQHLVRRLTGEDVAPSTGFDGDAIRHGRHPQWPEELTRNRPRARRPDEPPFRANGNTFDLAIGDIDNDGDFDLFVSTIIHAWAGESSDRSRFLVNQLRETGALIFLTFERLSVDRLPPPPEPGEPLEPRHTTEQNQGDIYAELADLNNDGRLDLLLCSSDYADEPPFDERARIFYQQSDGRFKDVTRDIGLNHIGAGMPSLADVDGDGDLDLLIGQSFNRLGRELRRAAALESGALAPGSPNDAKPERRARLFLNPNSNERRSIVLNLRGDPQQGVSCDALGTVVSLAADLDNDSETTATTQQRQLHGPAGHAGKQSSFSIHFGLGQASEAGTIDVLWPNGRRTTLLNVGAGRYTLSLQDETLANDSREL